MSFQRRASAFSLARRAGVRYMGDNGAYNTEEEYMANGTYAPTITVTGTGTADLAFAGLGWTRIGSTASPAAGDTVIVFGLLELTGMVDGDIVNVPLPFLADPPNTHGSITSTSTMTAYLALASAAVAGMVVTVTSDDTGSVSFSFTYQTANAVDP